MGRGGSYHRLAPNVNIDPEPFGGINLRGHAAREMTRLASLGDLLRVERVERKLERLLLVRLRVKRCGPVSTIHQSFGVSSCPLHARPALGAHSSAGGKPSLAGISHSTSL